MILVLTLVACALKLQPPEVPAWQRSQLMVPTMVLPADGAEAHVFGVREGLLPSAGAEGASCGCE